VGAAGQRQAGERRAAHRHRPHVSVRRPPSWLPSQRAAACQACVRPVTAARGLSRSRPGRRTTPEEGGETVFPQAATRVSGAEWSECAAKGLAVKTRRGDALLFYRCRPRPRRRARPRRLPPLQLVLISPRACLSAGGLQNTARVASARVASLVCRRGSAARSHSLTPSGEVDHSSLHGSCPTTRGEKWSATKWCARAPARPRSPRLLPRRRARAESCLLRRIHVGTFGGDAQAAKAKWCAHGSRRGAVYALGCRGSASARCAKYTAVVSARASQRVCKVAAQTAACLLESKIAA